MSDFFQTGAISTLHRLGEPDVGRLELELAEFSKETPIALVLPCHTRELGSAALEGIARELKEVRYLRQIVVGIDAATVEEWEQARTFFAQLPQEPVLIWNDGPRMKKLMGRVETAELSTGPAGKGAIRRL